MNPKPSLDIETIQDLFRQSVDLFGDHPAFQIKKSGTYSVWTYKDVKEMVETVSGSFYELGIRKGDRVAIIGENRPEWGMAYFCTAISGAIAVPLDKQLTPFEIETVLHHAGVKYVVAPAGFNQALLAVMKKVTTVQAIVSMEDEADSDGILSFRTLQAMGKKSSRSYKNVRILPDDIASIIYTSGTTGKPKGVMITHGNLISQVKALYPVNNCDTTDVFLSLLPMNHLYEFTAGFLGPFFCGSRSVYIKSLLPARIMEAFQECKVTRLMGVPLLYTLLYDGVADKVELLGTLKKWLFYRSFNITRAIRGSLNLNPGRLLFSKIHEGFGGHLRQAICGGAAIDPSYTADILAAGFPFFVGYGLSETSPIVTYGDAAAMPLGSVGRAINKVDVRIKSPDKEGVGEICVKGPNVMAGYYKNPEATAQAIRNGWFHTGDLGRLDEDGYLYICGRIKDMIVTHGGKKVFPEDLEAFYSAVDDVKEMCVVSVPKGDQGEEPAALIVPMEPDVRPEGYRAKTETAIRKSIMELSKKLPDYKRLKKVIFRSKGLPKTTTMKVRRFMVREEIITGLERDKKKK